MSYIKIKNLFFAYDNTDNKKDFVLKDINLAIEKGERLAVIGQNGAGKSTLVKQLNRLLKADKGNIFINNENIKKYTTAQLAKKVGFVFQNPDQQIFQRTVYDEIAFGPRNLEYSEEKIKKKISCIAKFLKLENYLKDNPYDLHFAHRKLTAVASTLAMDPEIVIFDEPTIGQSLEGKNILSRLLLNLSNKGKTIITITHDMDFAVNNFDRAVVLKDGRITADGAIRQIFWDRKILTKAGVKPPSIIRLAQKLGTEKKVVNINEFIDYINHF